MRLPVVLLSGIAVLGLAALASLLLDLSFQRAVLLAPVIVVSAGAVAGLAVLWGKAALEPFRRRTDPSDSTRTLAGRDGMDDRALSAGGRTPPERVPRD